jgi:hypothetical protein
MVPEAKTMPSQLPVLLIPGSALQLRESRDIEILRHTIKLAARAASLFHRIKCG